MYASHGETAELETLEPQHRDQEGPASPFPEWKSVLWLVLVAFAVRLGFMLLLRTYRFDRVDDMCGIGEITRIAASIAKGHGFSSPFSDEYTGPSAWIAPVYPYFIALIFRWLGIMTHASSIFIFVVQALLSALTVIPIRAIGARTVGHRAGLWAAWTWAVFPWFSKWSVTWLWEVSLSALLFSLLFWYALCLPEFSSKKHWIGFGALWGFALLVNPALSPLLPVSLAWCGYRLHCLQRQWRTRSLAAILACVIVMSPWLIRNRVVFGQWVFLRSNFGVEFAIGNYHTSFGRGWGGKHPSGNRFEYAEYKHLGEIAYVKSRASLGTAFVRDNTWEFITLTAKRIVYFWDGSAAEYRGPVAWYWIPASFGLLSFLLLPGLLLSHRNHVHGWPMFFAALLLYPIPYYLTYSQVRYRHVIEPLIVLLVAHAAVATVNSVRSASRVFRIWSIQEVPS